MAFKLELMPSPHNEQKQKPVYSRMYKMKNWKLIKLKEQEAQLEFTLNQKEHEWTSRIANMRENLEFIRDEIDEIEMNGDDNE